MTILHSQVDAAPLPLSIVLSDGASSQQYVLNGDVSSDGAYHSAGAVSGPTWLLEWTFDGNLGPNYSGDPLARAGVHGSLAITNTTDELQTYIGTARLVVGDLHPATRMWGSWGGGAV